MEVENFPGGAGEEWQQVAVEEEEGGLVLKVEVETLLRGVGEEWKHVAVEEEEEEEEEEVDGNLPFEHQRLVLFLVHVLPFAADTGEYIGLPLHPRVPFLLLQRLLISFGVLSFSSAWADFLLPKMCKDSYQMMQFAVTGQIIRFAVAGQIIRFAVAGQIIRFAVTGQIIRFAVTGQIIRFAVTGQIQFALGMLLI